MDNFGLSFSPLGQGGPTNPNNPGTPSGGGNPVQDAIKVLSLRIPKVVGAGAPSPQVLLGGAGGGPGGAGAAPGAAGFGGGGNAALFEQLLRSLFGGGEPQTGINRPGMPPAPNMRGPFGVDSDQPLPMPTGGNLPSPNIGYHDGPGTPPPPTPNTEPPVVSWQGPSAQTTSDRTPFIGGDRFGGRRA